MPGHFGLSAYQILMFFLFQIIYFDVENPKMKIILWRNYLLTLKLAYIYQYFSEILRFLCDFSMQTRIDRNLSFVDELTFFFFILKLCHRLSIGQVRLGSKQFCFDVFKKTL